MPRLCTSPASGHDTGNAGHTNTEMHLASLSSWPTVGLSFPICKGPVVSICSGTAKEKG